MSPRRIRMSPRRIVPLVTALLLACVALAACGDDGSAPAPKDFAGTRDAARGQTVRWWMFGGDDKVNAFVDDTVAPAARRLGVKIEAAGCVPVRLRPRATRQAARGTWTACLPTPGRTLGA